MQREPQFSTVDTVWSNVRAAKAVRASVATSILLLITHSGRGR